MFSTSTNDHPQGSHESDNVITGKNTLNNASLLNSKPIDHHNYTSGDCQKEESKSLKTETCNIGGTHQLTNAYSNDDEDLLSYPSESTVNSNEESSSNQQRNLLNNDDNHISNNNVMKQKIHFEISPRRNQITNSIDNNNMVATHQDDDDVSYSSNGSDSTSILLREPLLFQKSKRPNQSEVLHHDNDSNDSFTPIVLIPTKTSIIHRIANIYVDQSGSMKNIFMGISIIVMIGTIIGCLMPKNDELPLLWYRYFSSVVGYTYFVAWSVSYYPQIITNYQRKSIHGVSTDASIMQVLNCTCYAIYNAFFFYDQQIRQEYKDRNGSDSTITVQSNDVAFSFHALFISILLLLQITYYDGFRIHPISRITKCIVLSILFFAMFYMYHIMVLHSPGYLWIDFLYILATIKLILTITSYIPQLILNYQRKSTFGFNIWNIYLDCVGGVLSLSQLLMDSIDLHNYRKEILGNWAKLVLGIITLCFDTAFFIQHFVIYPHKDAEDDDEEYRLWESSSHDDDNDDQNSVQNIVMV